MEVEANLRVASDRMLKTLDQLELLENEKRTLKPGSPRFQTLAREIERLASEVFAQSHAQEQLGEQARAVERAKGVQLPPINEASHARDLAVILGEWRDAERRLSLADEDSAEHATALADAARLRDEYHASYTSSTEHADSD